MYFVLYLRILKTSYFGIQFCYIKHFTLQSVLSFRPKWLLCVRPVLTCPVPKPLKGNQAEKSVLHTDQFYALHKIHVRAD